MTKKEVYNQIIGNIMTRNSAHRFGGIDTIHTITEHNLEDNLTTHNKIYQHTKDDIDKLQLGRIPSNVLYSKEASDFLTKLDKNRLFIYTSAMGNGAFEMFSRLGGYGWDDYPHLKECISITSDRIDIGTGNGLVTNMVAFPVFNANQLFKVEKILKGDSIDMKDSLRLHCCDLSEDSLQIANSIANDEFHQLSKLLKLDYNDQGFESLLLQTKENKARLITMFNMLTNFDKQSLHDILVTIYNLMNPGDVFIPTFFHNPSYHYEDYHETYGYDNFKELSLGLYDNLETKQWIIDSFSKQYNIPTDIIDYKVTREDDGRPYIKVSILLDSDVRLTVYDDQGGIQELQGIINASGRQEFMAFHSYRMSQDMLSDEIAQVGFGVDGWLHSANDLQVAPLLYKK